MTSTTHAIRPWTKMGRELNSNNIDEIVIQAGLNWTVSKRPMATICNVDFVNNPDKVNPSGL